MIVFAILGVLACVAVPFVVKRLNSEVMSYLPEDTQTVKGLDFLSEKFGIVADNIVGITGADKDEATEVADKLDRLYYNGSDLYIATEQQLDSDGFHDKKVVTQCVWRYSEFVEAGIFMADDETAKEIEDLFYSAGDSELTLDDTYVYMLMIDFSSSSDEAFETLDFIQNNIVKDGLSSDCTFYQFGTTKMAKDIFESTIGEVWAYSLVGFAIVLAVLFLFTKSWIDPVVILLTLGVSILLNIGSNIIFKTNSIITFASSSLLQLALSVDYSVFMIHAYREECKATEDRKLALEHAIPRAFKSVFASAMTTLGGFAALYFMRFGIGADMGGVLAKGILMSFISVLFLQPAFMIVFGKQMDKWQHKSIDLKFRKPIKNVIKYRSVIVILLIIAIFPVVLYQSDLPLNYFNFVEYDEQEGEVYDMVDTMAHQLIVAVPFDIDSEENIDKQYDFVARLNELSDEDGGANVSFTLGFASVMPRATLDEMLDYGMRDALLQQMDAFVSDGYTMYTVGLTIENYESQEAFNAVEKIQNLTNDIFKGSDVYVTGLSQAGRDFQEITPNDFQRVTIASVLIIIFILLITFRSIKHSFVLILLIEFGIWINLCIQKLSGNTINFMSYIIISSIQLGATVDYAILITSKYRDLRKRMLPAHAAYQATTSSVMSVLTSATILAGACFCVRLMSTVLIVSEVTTLIAWGAVISAILALFALPAILAFLDRPANGGALDIPHTEKLSKRHIVKNKKSDKNEKIEEEKITYEPLPENKSIGGYDEPDKQDDDNQSNASQS